MILAFQLTMPGVGSWNGKWSGAGRFYGKVVNIGRSQKRTDKGNKIVSNSPYRYSWDDGWGAKVTAWQVDAKEAARLRRIIRKAVAPFCGYDWMVDSLIHYGDIRIMPSVVCRQCSNVRVGTHWVVPDKDILKYVHRYTICPDCVAAEKAEADTSEGDTVPDYQIEAKDDMF